MYEIRIFLAGTGQGTEIVLDAMKTLLETECKNLYTLEIINVMEAPEMAESAKILATPTVTVRTAPGPEVRVIGDLSKKEGILETLGLTRHLRVFTENILNAVTDTVFVFDPITGKPLMWNKALSEISGFTDKEIASMKVPDDWYGEEDMKRAAAATKKWFQGKRSTVEMSLFTKDGRAVPTEYTASLVRDEKGNPRHLIAVGRDITERKRAEEALRESEKKYRTLFEYSRDAVVISTREGKLVDVNQAWLDLYGLTREEIT
ncbi:MAG: PAS domain S-box protein, partial [Desulfobacteria bacterium]